MSRASQGVFQGLRELFPEEVSAILRSNEEGPEAPYPTRIGVYCDRCHWTEERDFIVTDSMTKPERLELIRNFARMKLGWFCGSNGDDVCRLCRSGESE